MAIGVKSGKPTQSEVNAELEMHENLEAPSTEIKPENVFTKKLQEMEEKPAPSPSDEPKEIRVNAMLVSGAEIWDFDANPEFNGVYKGVQLFPDGHEKEGEVLGFLFVDDLGESAIIGASHSIIKALETKIDGQTMVRDLKNPYLSIRFLGKTVNGKGQSFNRFQIELVKYEA